MSMVLAVTELEISRARPKNMKAATIKTDNYEKDAQKATTASPSKLMHIYIYIYN